MNKRVETGESIYARIRVVREEGFEGWTVNIGRPPINLHTFTTEEQAWAYACGLRDGYNQALSEVGSLVSDLGVSQAIHPSTPEVV